MASLINLSNNNNNMLQFRARMSWRMTYACSAFSKAIQYSSYISTLVESTATYELLTKRSKKKKLDI